MLEHPLWLALSPSIDTELLRDYFKPKLFLKRKPYVSTSQFRRVIGFACADDFADILIYMRCGYEPDKFRHRMSCFLLDYFAVLCSRPVYVDYAEQFYILLDEALKSGAYGDFNIYYRSYWPTSFVFFDLRVKKFLEIQQQALRADFVNSPQASAAFLCYYASRGSDERLWIEKSTSDPSNWISTISRKKSISYHLNLMIKTHENFLDNIF